MSSLSEKQEGIVHNLVEDLKQIDGVVGIALGGSFARGNAKPESDIDIGLYYQDAKRFSIEKVWAVAQKYNDEPDATVTDFGGWGEWVNGGAWLTIEGQRVDFLYRSVDRLQQVIDDCVAGKVEYDLNQLPATGFYNYIYLGELNICQPLFDPDEVVAKLKAQVETYPPKLKDGIFDAFAWVADFSLIHAEKAVKRDDIYALLGNLHRALSCVVQMIYAQNEKYFISDKGAIAECSRFDNIPDQLKARVQSVLSSPDSNSVYNVRLLLNEVTSNRT